MIYNYSNLSKLPFMGHNLPALPAPVSNCAQAYAPAYAPCATNSCHNHFNSYNSHFNSYNSHYDIYHNHYDIYHNPYCETFDYFC